MSTTMTTIDGVTNLNNWLQGLTGMYTADINAIPDDKLDWSPGGCARSAKSITTEVVGMCKYAAALCRGEEPQMTEDSLAEAVGNLDTKAKMVEAFSAACQDLSASLTSASPDVLNKVVTPPWQMDAPVYMIAQIMVSHIWYHDGQLNYIQSLLGDEKVHWMG